MLTCPKCNFIQPPDQFCAKCGVNIEKFEKKNSTRIKKVSKNQYLQFALVFITVVFLTNFIITQMSDTKKSDKKISEFTIEDNEDSNEYYEEENAEQITNVSSNSSDEESNRENDKTFSQNETNNSEYIAEKQTIETKGRVELKIIYAEILTEYFYQIAPEENTMDNGVYAFDSIREVIEKGIEENQIKVLLQSSTKRLRSEKSTRFTKSLLQLNITSFSNNNQEIQMDLNFIQNPRFQNITIFDQSVQTNITVPYNRQFAISNILQSRSIDSSNKNTWPLLKLYDSNAFLAGDSVFVVFFELSYPL